MTLGGTMTGRRTTRTRVLLAAVLGLALAAPGAGYAASGSRHAAARRCGFARCVAAEPEAAAAPAAPAKKKYRIGPRQFPLSAIVGMDNVKTALLLASINPYIGGVVIAGSRGTAKSVMARAAHSLMPPIEVVKGSAYNVDPNGPPGEVDSFLLAELEASGQSLSDLETEVIDVPFCQVRPRRARRGRAPACAGGAARRAERGGGGLPPARDAHALTASASATAASASACAASGPPNPPARPPAHLARADPA